MSEQYKRLSIDIKKFLLSEHDKDGIYVHIDENDITNIKAMIIGNDNTPYAYGFHFFTLKIPKTYPFDPPIVKYITGDGVTRFNPNLYVDGKVCLSILGTWSGPPWSPLFSFGTVLLSIKSMILNEFPLQNEPGYEKTATSNVIEYNAFVQHQNLKVALLQQLVKIPSGFEVFEKVMQGYVLENKDKIRALLLDLIQHKNKVNINFSVCFNCKVITDYEAILSAFDEVLKKFEKV